MATFAECVIAKADAGILEREQAERLAQRFNDTADDIARESRLPYPEARRRAAANLQDALERETNRKRRMHLKQATIEADLRELAEAARNAGIPVERAMAHRISWDPRERGLGPSLDYRINVVKGEAHASMAQFLSTYRTRAAGLSQRVAGLEDVIRELHGEGTGNPAAEAMAGGLKQAMDRLRGRYNAAGGDVLVRQDFGLWHNHDSAKIAAAGKDRWKQTVLDRIDPNRMYDASGQKITFRQLTRALDEMYQDIVTGGKAEKPIDSIYGSSVNGRAQRRFLAFRSADDWIAYHREFGSGNLFEHVVGNIEAFAKDVAVLEVIGPYPEATLRTMVQLADEARAAEALAATGEDAARAAGRILDIGPERRLRALYDTVTGRLSIPANGAVASISQANRNIVVASVLGGAWFSSFADVALVAGTARMNGMSVAKTLARQLKLFLPGSAADQRQAVRLGFTAQGWSSRAIAAQRILGEVVGPEWTERVADTVLRASLLSPWTQAGRWGFQTEMLAFITEQAGKTYRDLPAQLRTTFERYMIGPTDWELIRRTPQYVDPETGASFIRAEDVSQLDAGRMTGNQAQRFEAANKLQQAIMSETSFAIVEANPRVRAALTGGAPAGSFWGEVMRNTAMFKSFPVTVLHTHLSRIMAAKGIRTKAEAAAWLIIGTTVMGALGEQLSQISKGRDPLDMQDPKFWAQAAARGGGVGVLGDFVFSDQNRFGGGLAEWAAGPVIGGQMSDAIKLTIGNIQQLAAGKDTGFGSEAARFIKNNTPGQSLWYLRTALERMVFDQIAEATDPKANRRFRQVEQRARKDYKQRFWWRPGRIVPDRPPDLEAAAPN